MPQIAAAPATPSFFRLWMWRALGHFVFVVILAAGAAWAATAFLVHLKGIALWIALAVVAVAGIAALIFRLRYRRAAWGTAAIAALACGLWYQTIQPSQTRDWAAEVAHGVSYTRTGDIITLSNVRNFNWTDETTAIPAWETRSYDLAQLQSVDMLTSVWDSPDIAHLMVSFGFAGGQHLAFSVEIRREKHEVFSTIGGFFRQFELVLIAADERDVVRLRTNLRREDVRLFPIKLKPEQQRTLLLSYLDLGNSLAAEPQFYNTVTANCTSTVYRLVQTIKPDMPLDIRLLLSGRLPEYINELGGLQGDLPMDQRRLAAAITAKAQEIGPDQDYSALIRAAN